MEMNTFSLRHIEGNHPITEQTDAAFLFQLQHGLLLALKERGTLNEFQYRDAFEQLSQSFRRSRTPERPLL